MARNLVAFVAVAFALSACDDPAVEDAVLGALEHGVVSAQAVCPLDTVSTSCNGTTSFRASASLLLDGSSFVEFQSSLLGATAAAFNPRGQPVLARARMADDGDIVATFASGEIEYSTVGTVCGFASTVFLTVDISDDCSGFNLEAFE